MNNIEVQAVVDAAIATALAAFAANQQAANPAVAQVLAPGIFSMTPGLANAATPWDYSTSGGAKVYQTAVKPILPTFDGTQKNLKVFLQSVETKANRFGWTHLVLNIPDAQGVARDLLSQYGMLTIEEVRTEALTYVGDETRAAQASGQIAEMLMESIDGSTKLKLMLHDDEYIINGFKSGTCMLKCLISVVTIETRATVSCIRSALSALPELMNDVGSDITAFNLAVSSHLDTLRSVDQTCDDLLNKLFEAYQTASDSDFKEYIKHKESAWEDNTLNILPANLMKIADDQYKNRIVKRTWNKASKEETNLLALQADTAKSLAELVALQASLGSGDGSTKQKSGKAVQKKSDRRKNEGEWAWKNIAPSGSQSKTKSFKGRDYVACPFHGEVQWVLKSGHEGGCRNDPKTAGSDAKTDKLTPNTENKTRAKYIKALMNAMGTDSGDDEDTASDEENI